MPYRRLPPKNWPAQAEVRALARQRTVKAMNKLIELIDAKSQFVSLNASRSVLMHSETGQRKNPRFRHIGERGFSEVKVKIAQFKEEKQSGSGKRGGKLPVVQRRRKGPRHAGDEQGERLHTLRRKRTGVRDEPAIPDGTTPGLSGAGAAAGGDRGGAAEAD